MNDIDGIHEVLHALEPYRTTIEADFNRQNEQYLALAATEHDTIGRVLKAHLVIETFLDAYLKAHYSIENLDEVRLTFAQKAKILPKSKSSAAFVRPGILQLNSTRNKFGHRLNHVIESNEISALYEVLRVARPSSSFATQVDVIEAFTPVACAFLTVPSAELQHVFMDAFAHVRTHDPIIDD